MMHTTIRPLSKLASGRRMVGALDAQNRSLLIVNEDSSTKSTHQATSEIEFGKRSICKLATLFLILLVSACSHKKKLLAEGREAHFIPVSYSELTHWNYDSQLDALEAFKKSCRIIVKKKSNQPISKLTNLGGKVKDWLPPCNEALRGRITTDEQARHFFEKWFVPYRVTDKKGITTGKFTGYYEIELKGSRQKKGKYVHPVYRCPPNIHRVKGKSSISHAAINNGALKGKSLEIAYVDNKARLFFMHVQGSGAIILEDGCEIKVGYHEQNGHSYKTIGPLFKYHCNEKIRSAVDMMRWMHKNPKPAKHIMEKNPSYVFFKEVHGESPIGGQGVALTAERSIAIDHKLYPYSTPIWVQTTTPKTSHFPSLEYNRLFIAQDTGGAIKGAVRADIFYGRGEVAEELAGYMNNMGSYYVLFPKSVKIPTRYSA